jgi:hypothetical protein
MFLKFLKSGGKVITSSDLRPNKRGYHHGFYNADKHTGPSKLNRQKLQNSRIHYTCIAKYQ